MRFSLKFALSAVLANTIAAELAHTPQAQQLQNELDAKYVLQPQPLQQQDLQPTFRQAEQAVSSILILLVQMKTMSEHPKHG